MTRESVTACISDRKLLEQITARREHASERLDVNATPAFFINGARFNGHTFADFDKALGELVKG